MAHLRRTRPQKSSRPRRPILLCMGLFSRFCVSKTHYASNAPRHDGGEASSLLRHSLPGLQLAIAHSAVLAVVLRAALDRHRIVGHVLRDDRARADIGAVADL